MLRIFLTVSVITCIFPVSSDGLTISDEDYRLLPPIYKMDDYQDCVGKKSIYCTIDIKLDSSNKSSNTWKLIEETRKDRIFYNHDVLHRSICMPVKYKNKPMDRERFATILVNKEIEQFNLTSKIVKITCNQDFSNARPTNNYLMYISFSYFILIVSATLYDLLIRRQNRPVKGNPILLAFSLRSNYDKIFNQNRSKHYQKLKCIEGLRTITAVTTILVHCSMSYVLNFLEDTKFIEDMSESYYLPFIITATVFVMQIFILISAWLLTIQVYDIFEANKKFTVKDAFVLFINRCFRFWPALIMVMTVITNALRSRLTSIAFPHILAACMDNCQNYGWASLLFVQNNFKMKYMCFAPGWYISNDIQLFVMSLVILYTSLKFKVSKYFLGFCLFVSCALFGSIIYLYNLDIINRFYPEHMKWRNVFNDWNFVYLYSMAHVNSITCILGICFGRVYYTLQDDQIFNKKILFLPMWNYFFVGLPVLAIAIASREYRGLSAAVLGPLVRLLFSSGMGMGILGMSRSTGGIKKLFEWRPLEFLGQFTFCSFMYHSFVVFPRTLLADRPFDLSSRILLTSSIQDIVSTFLLAIVMYLLVELPCANLQKIVLPHVKKRTKIE